MTPFKKPLRILFKTEEPKTSAEIPEFMLKRDTDYRYSITYKEFRAHMRRACRLGEEAGRVQGFLIATGVYLLTSLIIGYYVLLIYR